MEALFRFIGAPYGDLLIKNTRGEFQEEKENDEDKIYAVLSNSNSTDR